MPQPKLHWTAYLWPGLPHLWVRGSWVGLALAVGFSVLLNALLATSLVWHELLPARVRWTCLAVLVGIWVLAWAEARADWRRWLAEWSPGGDAEDHEERDQRTFRQAQQCYLAGDWVAAEKLLRTLVRRDNRDIEARLLLATMWRHQKRYSEAIREIDDMRRFEAAAHWDYEIQQERGLLNAQQQSLTSERATDSLDAPTPESTATKKTEHSTPTTSDNLDANLQEAPEEQIQSSTESPAGRLAA